ncbi:magnesium-translocating P-type ATPase [Nocardiopsis sediminis]|uniref:Magnesium-transporting ATPase, P-type 1 n=1 Tax=Nocardiopsis sediminis TaxID=1778267 RepID=A0ABV8FNC5_9ACTN
MRRGRALSGPGADARGEGRPRIPGIKEAARQPAHDVLRRLGVVVADGLEAPEAERRRSVYGPNTVASHRARLLPVLWHQLRSPLLALLLVSAVVSYFVGEQGSAVIIIVILALSVGLGFANEYRAERAAQALHAQIRHWAAAVRGGRAQTVDVTALVPGDVVELRLGDVVPADIRLLTVTGLECDESVLTGESLPVAKGTDPVGRDAGLADLSCCALMGTIVHAGTATGVVVATGARTEFGAIAAGLDTHQLDTEFSSGLRRFSLLLVYVAGCLTTGIFAANIILHKPIVDALLFSLAIAVGITPQLLPAVVSTSLAAGSRRMRRRRVLVKRLSCIEDLGNVDTLFTDKTGTLTEGRIDYLRSVPAQGRDGSAVLRWGLLCTEDAAPDAGPAVGNPLDQALWASDGAAAERDAAGGFATVAVLPFDHERRLMSALVRTPEGEPVLVTKGAPEAVIARCDTVSPAEHAALDAEFAAGNRVVAVATRPAPGLSTPTPADEQGLMLLGLLVFADPPKDGVAEALRTLDGLGVEVKVVTGDNATVAEKVCRDLHLRGGTTPLTGSDVDALDDAALTDAIARTIVFARMSPEHKARVVRLRHRSGGGVAFLGDGVNDALALHAADVGISVDSATDVTKDAADVILMEKDLAVLADGFTEGRRIFANTIKYILMGTSSNFGNMFSAAGASLFLPFLPMLPSQILLNNLLYDTGQLAIPTDRVDAEQLRRPSHWDIGFIRRFMICFGPLSSVFDVLTFVLMLGVFHTAAEQFHSGWFIESLATQTLVIFAIRTRRIPFLRSLPSVALALASLGVVAAGAVLLAPPLARVLGFQPLPGAFFAALIALVVGYLALVEAGKVLFYRAARNAPSPRPRPYSRHRHIRRRASRFSTATRIPRRRAERITRSGRP